MSNDELQEKWPQPPSCTRDRLSHLLDVFQGEPDETIVTQQIDEVTFTMPGVRVPSCALTLGDLRILAEVAIGGEYALDGETGSEIEVDRG
jgi:hypothetical protein